MASKSSIYDQLKKDHEQVKQILEQMMSSKATQKARRRDLVARLKQELLAHAHAEKKLFYSELEHHEESRDIALEGEEEHHAVEALLKELERTDPADEHWEAKVSVLKEMLSHHIEEEESEMFSAAHEVLDREVEQRLAQRFPQQKQQERKRL